MKTINHFTKEQEEKIKLLEKEFKNRLKNLGIEYKVDMPDLYWELVDSEEKRQEFLDRAIEKIKDLN